MNPILKALESGFTEDQVIDFLVKKFPKYAKKFASAQGYGFTSGQILNSLLKKSGSQGNASQGGTEYEQTRRQDIEDRQRREKTGGQLALLAGASLASPIVSKAIQRAIPSSLQGLVPSLTTKTIGQNLPTLQSTNAMSTSDLGTQQPPVNPNQINPIAGNITQEPQTQQPKINITQLLNKHNATGKINDLIKSGNGAETVAAYFKKFSPQIVKDIEKETGDTIENVIGQYAEENQNAPQEQKGMEPEGQKLDVPKEATEVNVEAKPIAKNETVASPQGVGEVREIRGDKALIDIDGKLHKVDIEDLEQEPEDIIETVQNLLKIPEVDRSSVVSLFTYDPSDNEMYIQYHNGETYKYLDVDPEKVYAVANKIGIPVTQGKNIFGAWSPEDKQSLGATLIKEIINDPKYKKTKKGEEPNPNYRQLDTLYDYWQGLRKKPKRKRL